MKSLEMTKGQEQMFVLIQDLCLAFIINGAATICAGGISNVGGPVMFMLGMFIAFTTNYIAGIIIPVNLCGNAVCKLFHLKPGTFPHKLVRIFIINAIYVTIVSLTIALFINGATMEAMKGWWQTYWILHLTGFVASVLLESGCIALAKVFIKNKNSKEIETKEQKDEQKHE